MSSQPQPPHTGAVPSIEERIEDIGLPDGYSKPTFESTGQFRQIVTWTPELTEKLAELMQDYAIEARKPLEKMLDSLGVEKCPVCGDHLIDDDMNICESCDYGVHEWCTGYTYDGEGEHPAESAYAICKNCYKPEQRTTNLNANKPK